MRWLAIILLFGCTKVTHREANPTICDFGTLSNISFEQIESARAGARVKDRDKDGVADIYDNCPSISNRDQKDSDSDGIGDVCDPTPYPPTEITTPVIMLDFDGYKLPVGSIWNSAGYDCQPSGLLPEDMNIIIENVKFAYRNFNVLVTSDEATYQKSDPRKRMRVVITTSSEVYPGFAGVAYVGSMFWGDDTPCFVFSNLSYYDPKRIYLTSSHEAGHTIGLYHQALWDANCNLISSYRNCDRTINAGPIMGNAISCDPLWWVGPTNYGCKDIQNDSLKMVSNLK